MIWIPDILTMLAMHKMSRYIANFKLLQSAFKKKGVDKVLDYYVCMVIPCILTFLILIFIFLSAVTISGDSGRTAVQRQIPGRAQTKKWTSVCDWYMGLIHIPSIDSGQL